MILIIIVIIILNILIIKTMTDLVYKGSCKAEGEPTVPAAQLEQGRATPGDDQDADDEEEDHEEDEDEEKILKIRDESPVFAI